MKEQCMICGSVVEDVAGICPVCGAVLGRSTQVNSIPGGTMGPGPLNYQNTGANYGQPAGYNNGYTQPGYPGVNMGYGQGPYNYQNPAVTAVKPPKKKLLSILSIVMAALAVLTACVPVLPILFAIASIVLGIIALVKKQIKVPAVLGFVFSGITILLAVGVLIINSMMRMVCGTNVAGILEQSIESFEEDIQPLDSIVFNVPTDNGDELYSLHSDGTYVYAYVDQIKGNTLVTGTYNSYGYVNESARELMDDEVLAAMREGYHIKNVTCLVFEPHHYYVENENGYLEESLPLPSSTHLVFVVPDNYQKGDIIYQIEVVGEFDQKLNPIYPDSLGSGDNVKYLIDELDELD